MLAYLQRFKPNTLFYKLLGHFFAVILLLSSYNAWSLTYYTGSVDSEVVSYNRTIIRNTVNNLENQFTLWEGMLLNLQFDDRVQKLDQQGSLRGKASLDYSLVSHVINQLRALSSHPGYLLDNVMVLYKQHGFVLDKESLIDTERMFSHYYVSGYYPVSYWLRKDGLTSDLTPSPTRAFLTSTGRTRQLMPVELNLPGSSVSIIGLVNMDRWYAENQGGADSRLYILKGNGPALYQSVPEADASSLPVWDGRSDWMLQEDTYYFYEKGSQTGYTYVTAIPRTRLNANISRMNWMAIGLFAVTLLFGILASLLFSQSINRPLKQMLRGLGSSQPAAYRTSIREFDAIYEQISVLQEEKEGITRKLNSSESLLTRYSYMARLKDLYLHMREAREPLVADGTYLVVVHQIRFRTGRMKELNQAVGRSKTTGSIGDLVDLTIRETYPVSYTIQMESDQLLSVLYTNERSGMLADCLNELKRALAHDADYYLVTMAVSSLTSSSSDFSKAYEEATALLTQTLPVNENQILWGSREYSGSYRISAEQEHALFIQMQAGNEAACRRQLEKLLSDGLQAGMTAAELKRLAEAVTDLARRVAEQHKLQDTADYTERLAELEDCVTPDEYGQVLGRLISDTSEGVRQKREESSDLMQKVKAYLEQRYAEDISLESLADQLGLTPNYLSMSIKDRTGQTFSEHLNEIRITKAKELLECSRISVQEVGERIGYRNPTSFNRMFKKETGMPPGDYRKTKQRRLE